MITFRKLRFSPSFDPFLVLNQPLFKAFWDFPWAKTRHHGLKMGPYHLFEHHKWSRITVGKTRFSPIFDPFLVPKRPIFILSEGLSGSLGDSEAWKPQKVGACGWTRRPRNSDLSHLTQDTLCAWFRGGGAHSAGFWGFLAPFWAVSRTYCGIEGH